MIPILGFTFELRGSETRERVIEMTFNTDNLFCKNTDLILLFNPLIPSRQYNHEMAHSGNYFKSPSECLRFVADRVEQTDSVSIKIFLTVDSKQEDVWVADYCGPGREGHPCWRKIIHKYVFQILELELDRVKLEDHHTTSSRERTEETRSRH